LFPWAKFRRQKGAVMLHTILDLRGNIPCFIHISHGKMHDVNVLDLLPIEPGAFYVMDRGYVDYERLYCFTQAGAFFVTRGKRNLDCTRRERRDAVKTQVWIAISVYVRVAIVKKELGVERSLYEILQILSLTLFEKTSLFTALSESIAPNSESPFPNQRTLFDL
jgi:Transposase DDE domain